MTETDLGDYGFNDADGKRIWHDRVFATHPEDPNIPGVIVWLGRRNALTPGPISELKIKINMSFYRRPDTEKYLDLDFNKRVIRSDGGYITHLPPQSLLRDIYDSIKNPYKTILTTSEAEITKPSLRYGCGDFWVGIARAPLPPDWEQLTSRWPGWTHLIHAQQSEVAFGAFGLVVDRVHEIGVYPNNLKQLSRELSENVPLTLPVDKESATRWQFPWLDPRLKYHPLTGELMG